MTYAGVHASAIQVTLRVVVRPAALCRGPGFSQLREEKLPPLRCPHLIDVLRERAPIRSYKVEGGGAHHLLYDAQHVAEQRARDTKTLELAAELGGRTSSLQTARAEASCR